MDEPLRYVVNVWLKVFVIFTPFLVTSIFLGLTRELEEADRRRVALRATAAIAAICFIVFFFGSMIFALFGITLDAFRIGAGALLFLSSINLVQGATQPPQHDGDDFVVVPFAMPIVVGPAVMGILFVTGADVANMAQRMLGAFAVCLAVASLGGLLYVASTVENLIGRAKLVILSKVTGLILAALSAQMIFTGIRHFLAPT